MHMLYTTCVRLESKACDCIGSHSSATVLSVEKRDSRKSPARPTVYTRAAHDMFANVVSIVCTPYHRVVMPRTMVRLSAGRLSFSEGEQVRCVARNFFDMWCTTRSAMLPKCSMPNAAYACSWYTACP